MRFTIITGLSGAGRSSALKTFEDMGYFCADRRDFSPEHVVLNQIVGLKDTFAKVVKK